MENTPNFSSMKEAETTIKTQVLSLCETYSSTIKQILPTLKRSSSESTISKSDQTTCRDLLTEGNDHLHNLTQLIIEINNIEDNNQNLILEISAEVLANTVKYLDAIPKNLETTTLFKS